MMTLRRIISFNLNQIMKLKRKLKSKDKSLFSYYNFTSSEQKKYPVVSSILKQLTPERVKKEIEEVKKIELPPALQKWVREYEKVGERDEYLWSWAYRSFQLITYPCVSKKYYSSLLEVKCLCVIFFTLIDDVADEIKNRELLDQMLKIPFDQKEIRFNQFNLRERNYLHTTIKLWNTIDRKIKQYPQYEKFKDILGLDLIQVLHIMRYAYLVNKNHYIINKTEYWEYFPYNMPFIFFLTVDLMCSPKFDIEELGEMREIAWQAQKLGQTINWLTTWEREVIKEDVTSGVFAYALSSPSNGLKIDDLNMRDKNKIIRKIKKIRIEKELLMKSIQSYYEIKRLKKRIETVNIEKFLLGIEQFTILQLSSKGNY